MQKHTCDETIISHILLVVYQFWWLDLESRLPSARPPVIQNEQLKDLGKRAST